MDERLRQVLRERVEAYLLDVERVLHGVEPGWPGQRYGFCCCPLPRPGEPSWHNMVPPPADAAGTATGHSARGAAGPRCARCGALRTPTWVAGGHQMAIPDLSSGTVKSQRRGRAAI